jgi:plastocyanin
MSKKTHTITITMSDGDFTYSPSALHAKIGETVSFTSGTLGPFAVSFIDETPFLEVTFSSQQNAAGQHCIEARQIQENTIGHHHYAVAVAQLSPQGPDNRQEPPTVFLDSGCPDIVVSDDGN